MQQCALLLHDIFQSNLWYLGRSDFLWSWEYVSKLLQLVVEILHELFIISFAKALRAALLSKLNGLGVVLGNARVHQVCPYQQCCSPLSRVAVHECLATRFDDEVHHLGNVEHLLEWGVRQVFPIAVEERNPIVHQMLWRVGETSLQVDAVTAKRVLSRLLQIEYRINSLSIITNKLWQTRISYCLNCLMMWNS